MEHSISYLAFRGSIAEAIAESKRQKKLFLVYISGDNAESTHLEESTWKDSNVAESISKYCILLHILEGSTDARNFSAIYPQKSVPCITALGYNGLQLWQNEGFVSADILASSLEKAWLSLHIQETTATFLTAAFASKKSETLGTNSSNATSFEQGSSSSVDVPSPSTKNYAESLEARTVASLEMENKGSDNADEGINFEVGASSGSVLANVLEGGENELSTSSIGIAKESFSPMKVDQNDTGVGHPPSSVARDKSPGPEGNLNVDVHHSEVTTEASQVITNEATEVQDKMANAVEDDKIDLEAMAETSRVISDKGTEAVEDKKSDAIEDDKIDVLDPCLSKSTDVHLNIRLLDGASLQEKFLLTSTLRMVKDYVDHNQSSTTGSYDLAIPYPRKVFNDQDLNNTLSDLGLFGRQALMVVPHHRATGYDRGGSTSHDQINSTNDLDSSNESNEGYFARMKKILSYVNPLSYLGSGASSSNSVQESQSSTWQYSPNPSLQNNLRGAGRPHTANSSSQTTPPTGGNTSQSRRPSSGFGSNIHTLKHDEDDSKFNGRNAFWNGNSTQYGGDNDGK